MKTINTITKHPPNSPYVLYILNFDFSKLIVTAVTVVCHVISASGRLVDVDILELSESPCSGVGICCTGQHGTGAADGDGIKPETHTGTD